MDEDYIQDIVSKMEESYSSSKSWDEFVAKTAEMADRAKSAMARERLQKKQEILKLRKSIDNDIENFQSGALSVKKSILNDMESRSANAIGNTAKSIHNNIFTPARQKLKNTDLLDVAESGKLDVEIEIAMTHLNNKLEVPKSVPKEAIEIAKVYNEINKARLLYQKDAGIIIDERADFTDTRSYDVDAVYKAGHKEFAKDILANMDEAGLKHTFKNKWEDRKFIADYLKNAWEKITSLERGDYSVDEGAFKKKFSELGSSQARSIQLKPGGNVAIMKKYGNGKSLFHSLYDNSYRDAKKAAAASKYGMNPEKFIKNKIKIVRSLLETEARENPSEKLQKEIKSLVGLEEKAVAAIRTSLGRNRNSPIRGMAENVVNGGKSLSMMISLGKVALSAVPDIATSVSFYASTTGRPYFQAAFDNLRQSMKALNSKQKLELADSFRIFQENVVGSMAAKAGVDEVAQPGALKTASTLFMKSTGLPWWDKWRKTSIAATGSNWVAKNIDNSFDDLNPRLKYSLGLFEINKQDFEFLKNGVFENGKDKYVGVDVLNDLPDELYAKHYGVKDGGFAKRELTKKFSNYLNEFSELGTPTPGSRQKRLLRANMKEDSAWGLFFSLATQWKDHPTTIATEVIPRIANADPTKHGLYGLQKYDMKSMGHFTLGMTAFGYVGVVLNDLARNEEPSDPFNIDTITQSFLRGGSGGLVGDYLLSDYDNNYRNIAQDLLGPTAGKLVDASKIWSAVRNGEGEKAYKKAVKTISKNMPLQNHLLFGPVVKDMLLDNWIETTDPGYKKRAQRRRAKQGKEKFVDF